MKNISYLLFLLLFLACNNREIIELPTEQKNQYLFLGHTYAQENRVDPRLEKIDYDCYKGIWLGGDLCSETTREQATLDYLDALFELESEDTHWAVGNHDVRNGNLEWIRAATKRELFYTTTKDGITIAVLDTNVGHVVGRDASCEERIRQGEMLQNLVDTLQTSSHLILLMHWVVWGEVDSVIPCRELANNCIDGFQFLCGGGSSRFPPFIYEQLVALEKRGIEVLVVSGDGGIFTKSFAHTTPEGINFFISGLYARLDRNNPPTSVEVNLNPDSILIFTHDVEQRQLSWEFQRLDDLVGG
ncbi:MAG: hypothetical protein AAGJ18_03470 [Bacteroidota bacterium]